MEQFILQLGMMSLQASVVIGVVLVVRMLFMQFRVPKKYMCILWILPYLCMICPWKIEADFGFWRMPEQVQVEQVQEVLEKLPLGNGQVPEEQQLVNVEGNTKENPEVLSEHTVGMEAGANAGGVGSTHTAGDEQVGSQAEYLDILFYIWFVGVIGLMAYSIVSYLQLRQKLVCSICMAENIYIADDIHVPFVLGIFKPRIFLPSDLPQENLEYVLAHEKTHIRRWDPLKKILALCISAVHWFNPLSWVAFHFLEKDMEMACDEETIQTLGWEHKKDYAEALLALSSGKKMFLGAPLAFDEGNVKDRICNILKYKKAWRVATGAAVVLIVVLTVCFMSRSTAEDEEKQQVNGSETSQQEEERAENESKTRRLAEYVIDLTGDRVDEQIVFEVESTASDMSNEEFLAQVWDGNLSLQVKILEGEQKQDSNSTSESSEQTERVLWENTYSGNPEENVQLAVLDYVGKTYLMTYNNDVNNGEGRFWYEVLSFKDGEQSVFAANEALYEVVDAREVDGKKLTKEQQAVIAQVQLIEEELQQYLRSSWMEEVLLKALSKREECFLYQGKTVAGGDAYDAFAVQAEGTGFERKLEDFFYTNMEGSTVMPKDARERVLAGEVLYLDVSQENSTAGNFDLDGDGQKERIYLESLGGYEGTYRYDNDRMFRSDYRLRVDDVYVQEFGNSVDSAVMLYSPDGVTVLMAVYDDGPSADPYTTFYQYDAKEKSIRNAGEMGVNLRDAVIENGMIKGSRGIDLIETHWIRGYWIWDGESIRLPSDEIYDYGNASPRYGDNGEEWTDGHVNLRESLTVYTEKDQNSASIVMQPQKVWFVSTDAEEWVSLEAEDGTKGWIHLTPAYKITSAENKCSSEVFEGLFFAG